MSRLLPVKPKLENTAYCRHGVGFQTLTPTPWLNRLTSQLQAVGALGVGPHVPVALAEGGGGGARHTEEKVGGGAHACLFIPNSPDRLGYLYSPETDREGYMMASPPCEAHILNGEEASPPPGNRETITIYFAASC